MHPRRALLGGLMAALLLPACGFSPALAPSAPAADIFGRVRVADPANRFGFAFRNALTERIGHDEAGPLNLTWRASISRAATAVDRRRVTTRRRLIGTLTYTLKDASGATLVEATERAFASYDALGSTVATGAALLDAEDRLAQMLADRVVMRIVALPAAAAP